MASIIFYFVYSFVDGYFWVNSMENKHGITWLLTKNDNTGNNDTMSNLLFYIIPIICLIGIVCAIGYSLKGRTNNAKIEVKKNSDTNINDTLKHEESILHDKNENPTNIVEKTDIFKPSARIISDKDEPLTVLKMRLAKGEITKEEFDKIKEELI